VLVRASRGETQKPDLPNSFPAQVAEVGSGSTGHRQPLQTCSFSSSGPADSTVPQSYVFLLDRPTLVNRKAQAPAQY